MFRVTKLTDYAIVLLTHMAQEPKQAYSARAVASATGLPQPTVGKILKSLVRGGLVVSERGVQGGYRLVYAAEQVSLVDVIDAVEGPVALTECSGESPDSCDLAGYCAVEANWLRINDAIRRALAGISLADMARPISPRLVTLSRLRQQGANV